MNVERLQEFVKLLRNLPEKLPELDGFDLGHWYMKRDWDIGKVSSTVQYKEGFCKTSACALGSAALYGPFVAQGLSVDRDYEEVVYVGEDRHWRGLSAARYFFDITYRQAEWLFLPGSYTVNKVTPEMVARRIKMILAGTANTEDYSAGVVG